MTNLEQLASLLARRNPIDDEIAALVDRPATRGNVGEWIAREIFRVKLAEKANKEGFDGWFADGPLTGETVNVKWYGKRTGILDIKPHGGPEYYLVMTGPKAAAASARGQSLPWVITDVFLFNGPALVEQLRRTGRNVGVAAGVRQHEWEAARIHPGTAVNAPMTLSERGARGAEAVRRG